MPAIPLELARVLQTVRRPGDFFATGRIEIFAPKIEVEGVGAISLPLLEAQAGQLIAIAEQAPYGRGEETLVDTAVRRTWQIAAERIRLGGRHWDANLAEIVARAAAGLGVMEGVAADLYKLLVYDTGSFFVGHRDTEKAPGMFATLVVVLPSLYSGGELLIRHREREVCLDLSCQEASEVAFAAFYADCWHAVRPISSGCRLVLIYNLIRQAPGQLPLPPAHDAEEQRLTDLLRRWAADLAAAEQDCPEKLIYPLEHVYTPAEIGFAALKNADAAAAAVLVAAARRANCDLHLAIVAIEESGSAEYAGSWSRRGRYADEDDDNFEVGEVFERSLTLSDWRTPDGSRPALARLPFEDEELCPPGALEDDEPDEQLFFEATGNAGATFERSYRRAAFVLWPQARKLHVIARSGREVSLPYLSALSESWVASGDNVGSALWNQGHQLARLLIDQHDDWQVPAWLPPSGEGKAAAMLDSLNRLQDRENLAAFLAEISAGGYYDSGDNEALSEALTLLPPEHAAALLEAIVAANAPRQATACAELVQRVASHFAANGSGSLLQPALAALVNVLPGKPVLAPRPDGWRVQPPTPALVVDLLTALRHTDTPAIGESVVDHLLAYPDTFAADAILVPAALRLVEPGTSPGDWAPTRRLVAAGLAHLEQRIAEPLAAPPDFARPSDIACPCSHCRDLASFLADRNRDVWVFKAAETHRRHVEQSIRRHACDVDQETDRRSRPYALVCTKNRASYERRVAQRRKDLEDRARLSSPTAV